MAARSTMIGMAAALLALVAATGAPAQVAGGTGAGAAPEKAPSAGSPLPGGGTTRDLTMPGEGGVAGTGLGGTTGGAGSGAKAPAAPGTGGSVKGPAGQGISGQGISGGTGAGTTLGTGTTVGR